MLTKAGRQEGGSVRFQDWWGEGDCGPVTASGPSSPVLPSADSIAFWGLLLDTADGRGAAVERTCLASALPGVVHNCY